MGKIRVEVDDSLKRVLEDIQKKISEDVKKKWGLEKITIYGTIASQHLAYLYKENKFIKFRIRKINDKEGILETIPSP